jgi:hypothetical protein
MHVDFLGIVIYTDLKDNDPCPKCKNSLKLHGYSQFGGHYLECYNCNWKMEGADK